MTVTPTTSSSGIATDAVALSIVIPCRDHVAELDDLLAALSRQQSARPYEVIVVDAAADDAVLAVAEKYGTRIVRSSEGLLAGQARDLGAAQARGVILLFIDADCQPNDGWIDAAVNALQSTGARIVGGPIGDLHPRSMIARADNLLQFADLPATRPAGTAHMLPTANLAVAADDHRMIGGFEHRFGVKTGEDVAFCERARQLWPDSIRFEPAMAVRHAGRTTLSAFLRHHESFGYSRGRLRLLLTERQARLGKLAVLAPAVVLRRLVYVLGRVLHLQPKALPGALLLTPLLMLGVAAWTVGFRRGLAEAEASYSNPSETSSVPPGVPIVKGGRSP